MKDGSRLGIDGIKQAPEECSPPGREVQKQVPVVIRVDDRLDQAQRWPFPIPASRGAEHVHSPGDGSDTQASLSRDFGLAAPWLLCNGQQDGQLREPHLRMQGTAQP